MNTPLWQALQAAAGRRAASFHTPGHKNGQIVPQALAAAWGSDVFRYDLTEIPGLDNLAHPEGVLAESMAAWAAARGCVHVQYWSRTRMRQRAVCSAPECRSEETPWEPWQIR